jgi:peptidyl-tRNA hydrolase
MDEKSRLYVVVRADLSPGEQLAQSCHALRAFVAQHPETDARWFAESNNLVVLKAKDEPSLSELSRLAARRGLRAACFREPDYDDALTAIALEPAAKPLLRRYALAG